MRPESPFNGRASSLAEGERGACRFLPPLGPTILTTPAIYFGTFPGPNRNRPLTPDQRCACAAPSDCVRSFGVSCSRVPRRPRSFLQGTCKVALLDCCDSVCPLAGSHRRGSKPNTVHSSSCCTPRRILPSKQVCDGKLWALATAPAFRGGSHVAAGSRDGVCVTRHDPGRN